MCQCACQQKKLMTKKRTFTTILFNSHLKVVSKKGLLICQKRCPLTLQMSNDPTVNFAPKKHWDSQAWRSICRFDVLVSSLKGLFGGSWCCEIEVSKCVVSSLQILSAQRCSKYFNSYLSQSQCIEQNDSASLNIVVTSQQIPAYISNSKNTGSDVRIWGFGYPNVAPPSKPKTRLCFCKRKYSSDRTCVKHETP